MPRTGLLSGDVEVAPLPGPVSLRDLAARAAAGGAPGVLLETLGAVGAALLAWDPALIVRVDAGVLSVRDPGGLGVDVPGTSRSADAPRVIEALLDRFAPRVAPSSGGRIPFQGGFVGYVGYEWAAGQEGPTRPGEAGLPDLWLGLFDRAIVSSADQAPCVVAVPSLRGATAPQVMAEVRALQRNALPRPREGGERARRTRDLSRSAFEAAVRDVRRRIRQGEVYQVNIAQRTRLRGADPWQAYDRSRAVNPSPFAGILFADDVAVVSGSPEELLRVGACDADGGRYASTRPIAGTRPRAAGTQDVRNERSLRRSVKEVAEHTMLVDLARNDLGRVCRPGSVEVDEWGTVERYSHVMHLVSNVRGRLDPGATVRDLFLAMMPGGSITGTPKIRATDVIAEVEAFPRGAYTGALGYISLDGQMGFNLLIRSAFFPHGGHEAHVYAGAGIVQDSRPGREWEETCRKAEAMLASLGPHERRTFPWAPPHRMGSWSPPKPERRFPDRRVLLIDNYDSFTYNLAQYLGALGTRPRIVRNDAATVEELRAWSPTHVVISPGPGSPARSGITLEAVRAFAGVPLLGVCLGHQAIVEAYGGVVGPARRPLHGKATTIRRVGPAGRRDILGGMPRVFLGARYHSLVATRVPTSLRVTAFSSEREPMAVEHEELPTYGVQFHPESMCTPGGLSILARFLALGDRGGGR